MSYDYVGAQLCTTNVDHSVAIANVATNKSQTLYCRLPPGQQHLFFVRVVTETKPREPQKIRP